MGLIAGMRALSSPPHPRFTGASYDRGVLSERRARLITFVVVALLAADVLFIGLNLAVIDETGTRRLWRPLWVGREWSLPEIMQNAKWVLMALSLTLAYRHWREVIYGVWALAFAAIAMDDSFSLHERTGAILASALRGASAVRPGYFELIPMAVGVAVLLVALWYGHHRPAVDAARSYSRVALLLLGVYGAFAVVVDALHLLVGQLGLTDRTGNLYLLLLEDGGELVAATILVAHTLRHVHLPHATFTSSAIREGSASPTEADQR